MYFIAFCVNIFAVYFWFFYPKDSMSWEITVELRISEKANFTKQKENDVSKSKQRKFQLEETNSPPPN